MPAAGRHFGGSEASAIRAVLPADVPAILKILEESPEASAWAESGILESAESGTAWVAEVEGHVAGFIIGRSAADEFEILNLAVANSHRRRGIATRLLQDVCLRTRATGTRGIYLEVRASNAPAQALYSRVGFTPCGRRARYYRDPEEDAIVFSWSDGPARS